jgi:phosphatidate cytidylyltransferase
MTRVLSGAALAAAFFAVVWYGNAMVLLVVALAVGALAFQEYAELVRRVGADIPRWAALAATLATIAIVPFAYVASEGVLGIGVVVIAMAVMAGLKARPSGDGAVTAPEGQPFRAGDHQSLRAGVTSVLSGAFAMVYIGVPLGALVGAYVFGGRGAVVLLVGTIAISDTAQYYAGRLLGRHPLAPRLSPKKTVEGALGGFVAAPAFLYFAGPYFVPAGEPLPMAALGVGLVACGIAGDLFESMIKRAAEMKDSSALIPGHGGVLDRIDALLFATPPFYLYLRWVYTT